MRLRNNYTVKRAINKINKNHFSENGTDDEEIADKCVSQSDTAKESEVLEAPIETSNAMKELLIALEFNSIDMYN